MARDTVRQTSHFVLGGKPPPESVLVWRRLIGHVEHLISRPEVLSRISVAFKAPLHVERIDLVGKRHLIHAAVTTGAADTLLYVNAVIEKNEVG
jgi:hypothetical protein